MPDRTISEDEWVADYDPLDSPDGSLAWNDQGDVRSYHPTRIWSYCDGETGGTYLTNGYLIGAYAWAVTKKAWDPGDDIEVVVESDEDYMARQRADLVYNAIEDYYQEKHMEEFDL